MKILIPVMSLSKSGGFKVLTQLANFGKNSGHQVTFVCPFTTDEPYYDAQFPVLKIDKKGDVVSTKQEHANEVRGIIKIIALWRYLLKYSRKYDAVIANRNLTVYPVYFGSRTKNFYYIQAYEPEFCYEYKNLAKRYSLMLIAWLSYFFPLTKIVNADIYQNYKNIKSEFVVPPGIDLAVFNPLQRTYSSPDEIVVGCIGRTEKWKGTEDVTKAVEILHAEKTNLRYKVAFNPIKYKDYELILPRGHEGLADFYRSIDVLIAPGHIQLGAAHYPVIEALACGASVITTGYYPADENNAYLVPIESPDCIVSAIKGIQSDPKNADNKRAKGLNDIKHLSWDNVARRFFSIIQGVTSDSI